MLNAELSTVCIQRLTLTIRSFAASQLPTAKAFPPAALSTCVGSPGFGEGSGRKLGEQMLPTGPAGSSQCSGPVGLRHRAP